MLAMHDNGTLGYTNPTANNPFDYLDGEVRDVDRVPAQHRSAPGRSISCRGVFRRACRSFYGSGQPVRGQRSRQRRTARPGTNRLNRQPPAGVADHHRFRRRLPDRFNGPAVITSGHGDSAQRARRVCRCTRWTCGSTKDIQIAGSTEGVVDRRGVQPVQPRQLRQLQHVAAARPTPRPPRCSARRRRTPATPTCRARATAGVPDCLLMQKLEIEELG